MIPGYVTGHAPSERQHVYTPSFFADYGTLFGAIVTVGLLLLPVLGPIFI
ncbi:MAG TPA: hypothetical protein VMP68_31300 [Candidatus Eisenbacteria bacterium]|nr:hypothetical protein [Candidatus Eisenbacteria bacterium]